MAARRSWSQDHGSAERRWRLNAGDDEVAISVGGQQAVLTGRDLSRVHVKRGWFSARIDVKRDGSAPLRLRGISRRDAAAIASAVDRARARYRLRPGVAATATWHQDMLAGAQRAHEQGRWIPQETRALWAAARPGRRIRTALQDAGPDLADLFDDEQDLAAIHFLLQVEFADWVDAHNEEILAAETQRYRWFFDNVESQPLTAEQIRAVVTYDNRVQVVAAAGSGKTSVMVARAAYAVLRGFTTPERILLLAFNKDAAKELQRRVRRGFTRAGLDAATSPGVAASPGVATSPNVAASAGSGKAGARPQVRANTFHEFGLSLVGQATGRKPRPADWVSGADKDVDAITSMVDVLRDTSPGFAFQWDLFRLLYAKTSETGEDADPDAWDSRQRAQGYATAAGEVVKSEGERLIADFLFYNGVAYTYEKPYSVDVADAEHSQYRPDFHYDTPTGDLWHEHWGLDANGRPRADFEGYEESMRWKKALHAEKGTALIETTWAQVMSPTGLHELAAALRAHGLTVDWNPDRRSSSPPMKHEDLARLIRQFMTHAKSNSLTREDLRQRVKERIAPGGRVRARLFLDLYGQIVQEWNARLQREGAVDFEDMLVMAAEHLERGEVSPDVDLVLVDEFQDASRARGRLTRALVAARGRYLLAVGDDWQSINRFAGADLSLMANFAQEFGEGPSLRLQTTFRSPQELCDTAGAFVSKNPQQLSKTVHSVHPQHGARVRLIVAATPGQLSAELQTELADLAQLSTRQTGEDAAAQQRAGRSPVQPTTVDVLVRYNFDKDLLPAEKIPGLVVTARTAHSSKGLEADYVIIPNLTRGTYGFPSTIQDDPLLALAMTASDSYPHAEERRLFYVALTRARRQVTLITVSGRESPFVMELIQDGRVDVVRSPGPPPQPCPDCGQGSLVKRKGPHGEFLGCTCFPLCRHTSRLPGATRSR